MVRLACERDFAAILEIMHGTLWAKTTYLEGQLSGGNIVVAECDSTVTGFIVWNREFFSLPFVWLVAVSPEHRRGGIAHALFAYVEERCSGSRLYSSTNESHAVMHRLFERRGYRRAGMADVDPDDLEIFYRLDL